MKINDDFLSKIENFNKRYDAKSKIEEKENASNESFGQILRNYIDDVNKLSVESDQLTNSFIRGDDGVNIEDVMLKASEASLGLQFLTTTRDKLLDGYKELIKMQ